MVCPGGSGFCPGSAQRHVVLSPSVGTVGGHGWGTHSAFTASRSSRIFLRTSNSSGSVAFRGWGGVSRQPLGHWPGGLKQSGRVGGGIGNDRRVGCVTSGHASDWAGRRRGQAHSKMAPKQPAQCQTPAPSWVTRRGIASVHERRGRRESHTP
jgi:hypothetical protein